MNAQSVKLLQTFSLIPNKFLLHERKKTLLFNLQIWNIFKTNTIYGRYICRSCILWHVIIHNINGPVIAKETSS